MERHAAKLAVDAREHEATEADELLQQFICKVNHYAGHTTHLSCTLQNSENKSILIITIADIVILIALVGMRHRHGYRH